MTSRKIVNLGLLLIYLSLSSSVLGPGKCTGDEEYNRGLNNIGNFRLIKDYRVSLKKGKTESFQISLTRGLKYKFYTVDNPDNKGKMVMTIYMKPDNNMKLASTQSSTSLKHYPSIEFECGKSGKYYLEIHIEGDEKGCGVGMFTVAK